MIDEKITKYKNGIITAKELSKRKYADLDYYNNIVSKFEKILRFYEDLKTWKDFTEE